MTHRERRIINIDLKIDSKWNKWSEPKAESTIFLHKVISYNQDTWR